MKKIIFISIFVLFMTGCFQFTKKEVPKLENMNVLYTEELLYARKLDDGSVTTKNSTKKIFNPTQHYSDTEYDLPSISLEDIEISDISEYVKYLPLIAFEQNLEHFDEKTIATFISFIAFDQSLDSEYISYAPVKEERIEELAKYYFNVDHFQLKEGTYTLKHNEYFSFTIIKSGEYYIRVNRNDFPLEYNTNFSIKNYERNENTFFVNYNIYDTFSYEDFSEDLIIGSYQIELNYVDGHFIFQNIKYSNFKNDF